MLTVATFKAADDCEILSCRTWTPLIVILRDMNVYAAQFIGQFSIHEMFSLKQMSS
jgi:hypothetical protein